MNQGKISQMRKENANEEKDRENERLGWIYITQSNHHLTDKR